MFSRRQKQALRYIAAFQLAAALAISAPPAPSHPLDFRVQPTAEALHTQKIIDGVSAFAPFFFANVINTAAQSYQVSKALRLRAGASATLDRTFAGVGSRTTITLNLSIKRGVMGNDTVFFSAGATSGSDTGFFAIGFNSSDKIRIMGGLGNFLITTRVFRDPNAVYNLTLSIDTNHATANNRIRLYVDDIEETAFDSRSNPTLAMQLGFGQAALHRFGFQSATVGFSLYADLLLSNVRYIDGQQLTPSAFVARDVNNVPMPIAYTGTYGTNGFELLFADNSAATAAAIGKDTSGNSNNFTPSGVSVTAGVTNDSFVDTPTNYGTDTGLGGEVRGNYCVLNPLTSRHVSVYSEANLKFACAGSPPELAVGSIAIPKTGKWFAECVKSDTNPSWIVGIAGPNTSGDNYLAHTDGIAYWAGGSISKDGTLNVQTGLATATTNDIIGILVDAGAQTVQFYKLVTGAWSAVGTAVSYSGKSDVWFACGNYVTTTFQWNFGQRPFAATAPGGSKALCTQNLPDPAIPKPSQYFDVVSWAGNATNPRSFTSLGFQPDLTWLKGRNQVQGHILQDVERGFTLGKDLSTDSTGIEGGASSSLYGGVTGVLSNGFTVNAGSTSAAYSNASGTNYIAWLWKRGALPGLDIVSFTGTGAALNVPHILGVVPELIIYKNKSGAGANWTTGARWLNNSSSAWGYYLSLNASTAEASSSSPWNSTAPTSSVFTVGANATAAVNFIGYVFASVLGFSKCGMYIGNASANGAFVDCGFRPRFILMKSMTGAEQWNIYDTTRDPINVASNLIVPSTNAVEAATAAFDIVSNGFKVRASTSPWNTTGGRYLFMAFADVPFKYARAR